MLTKANIAELEAQGYEYILGARVKSESADIKQQIQNIQWSNGQVEVIEKNEHTRLIVSFSEKRQKHDEKTRQKENRKRFIDALTLFFLALESNSANQNSSEPKPTAASH